MKEEKLLDLDEEYTLFQSPELSDEVLDFLENTAFGTQDNLYRHYYIREFVENTPRTVFFLARNPAGELVGVAAFCYRSYAGQMNFEGCYIRYYAVSKKIRGQKITKRFSKVVLDWLREQQKDPIIFFGSIEGTNKASRAVANHLGFESFAPLKVQGFSRFNPGMKGDVSRVSAEDWPHIQTQLEEDYQNHAFWSPECLNANNDYFVLKKGGRIVCGAQSHPAHWVIENMPGFIGKFVLPVLPYIPVINKIFNPQAFHFLTFEGVYVAPGHEADLADLFESILHIKQRHAAMIWFDQREPLYQFLLRQGKMGLLASITAQARSTFVADFTCFPEEEAQKLREKKYCYGKGYDYV